jgi:hypothetical protein
MLWLYELANDVVDLLCQQSRLQRLLIYVLMLVFNLV